jgi:hypothetical protein
MLKDLTPMLLLLRVLDGCSPQFERLDPSY